MNAPAEPLRPAALPVAGDLLGGKLRLERILGEGGMGLVFAATHEVLKRSVAVKVMRPEATSSSTWNERFLREARVLVDLESPHTTRVLDADIHEGRVPYIVMEMLAGEDLAVRVRREGPVPPALAIRWALETCDALHEAHQAGVVHRDLKPSNLFVQKRKDRESIKLLDFGIAKRIVKNVADLDLTESGTTMGSPRYAAPEQLNDARTADERTDVWGFGVTFYEVLAGRQAFAGDSLAIVVAQIMAGSPDYAALPPDLAKIIERCTQREKAARYPSIVELAADLLGLVPKSDRPMLEILRVVGARTAAPSTEVRASSAAAPPAPASALVVAESIASRSDPGRTPTVGLTPPPPAGALDLSLSPVSSGARAPHAPSASRSLRPSLPTSETERGGSGRAATALAALAAVVCAVVLVVWFSRPSGDAASAQPDAHAGSAAAPTPSSPAAAAPPVVAEAPRASAPPVVDVAPSASASAPTTSALPPPSRPKPPARPTGDVAHPPAPPAGRNPYADQH